jgi:hypothetical protein
MTQLLCELERERGGWFQGKLRIAVILGGKWGRGWDFSSLSWRVPNQLYPPRAGDWFGTEGCKNLTGKGGMHGLSRCSFEHSWSPVWVIWGAWLLCNPACHPWRWQKEWSACVAWARCPSTSSFSGALAGQQIGRAIGFCISVRHLYVDYCISPMGPEAMNEWWCSPIRLMWDTKSLSRWSADSVSSAVSHGHTSQNGIWSGCPVLLRAPWAARSNWAADCPFVHCLPWMYQRRLNPKSESYPSAIPKHT